MNAKPCNYPRLRVVNNLVDELVRIIRFPKGSNAEYNDGEIIRVIAYAASENLDIENAAQRLRAMGLHSPSPDVVLHRIGELSETEVVELFQRIRDAIGSQEGPAAPEEGSRHCRRSARTSDMEQGRFSLYMPDWSPRGDKDRIQDGNF